MNWKLNILVADASLELIPKKISKYKGVIRETKKKGVKPHELILDSSYHYRLISMLDKKEKRGRPDIVHLLLLSILGSPFNIEGYVNTTIRTVRDVTIHFSPKIRIPKNYNRFKGLMRQLLLEGKIPTVGEPLAYIIQKELPDLINQINPSKIIVIDVPGRKTSVLELAEELLEAKNPLLIVGGFPYGRISDDYLRFSDETYMIYKEPIDAWISISRVLAACEIRKSIL